MFSGHDYNLYALLAAFEIVTEDCLMENFLSYAANKTTPHPHCVFPHFAANIILEFENHTQNPQVKFLYNNMVIPICGGGDETCDYEKFLRVARGVTVNNTLTSFKEKCGVNMTEAMAGNSQEELLAQNQKFAGEQLITSEEAEEEDVIEVVVMYSSSSLRIALTGMSLLCIILFARLISRQRDYSILEEEVRGKEAKEREVLETEVIGISPKDTSINIIKP